MLLDIDGSLDIMSVQMYPINQTSDNDGWTPCEYCFSYRMWVVRELRGESCHDPRGAVDTARTTAARAAVSALV